ncbi:RPS6 [Symbiodinium natans]|uniref:RPS6 protein n=1 Tax=Symbiodinium natans TaxID=878477 RepID=A0A812ILP3_9DINO|nr:RPS6 [Symbiodinium natans]
MLPFAFATSILAAVAIVYVGLLRAQVQQNRHQLVAAVGVTQLLTLAQMLAVLRRFGIAWGEPFASLLAFLDIFSFDFEMLSFSCVTTMGPVVSFAVRVLMIPGILLSTAVVSLVHAALLAGPCRYTSKLSLGIHFRHLLKTAGALFMVLFIILFSMFLAPFQCRLHPNGRYTVQTYGSVHCDDEQHYQMFVLGILSCSPGSLPLLYLTFCTWLVVMELPRRLARSDTGFLQDCSFLIIRFRTGAEISSVAFLIRNVLVVLSPLPVAVSSKLLMMSLVLLSNLVLVAYFQPWS